MSEDFIACSYSEQSQRHAILAHDSRTGWVYLHAPSSDPESTGPVEATCFAYNRCELIDVKDVQSYRPGPPPIAKGYGFDAAVCPDPTDHQWRLVWSRDGEAVLLVRDEECWCLTSIAEPRGYSKAIRAEGPWGSPWSEDVYKGIEWSG